MEINAGMLALVILLMFVMGTLFVMRRRTRQGKRKPTF
jgi:hypothetical protein